MMKLIKRVIPVFLAAVMLVSLFTVPAAATTAEVVQSVLRSQLFYDDMYRLAEAVDSQDAARTFQVILEIYPDMVALIKKCSADGSVPLGAGTAEGDPRCHEAVRSALRNPVVFDALAKLCETVQRGDSGEIFMCILEIYPDFVAALKKGLEPDPTSDGTLNTASVLADTNGSGNADPLWQGIAIAEGVVIIALAAGLIVVWKKKSGAR